MATEFVVGVLSGLTAAAAMNIFQSRWDSFVKTPKKASESATAKAADAASKALSGSKVKKAAIRSAANAVHYLTGAALGGIYGVMAVPLPITTMGVGSLYGTAVWIVGDELAVPAFGLSAAPSETKLGDHGFALASHLVFGIVLDVTRRTLNTLISPSSSAPRLRRM